MIRGYRYIIVHGSYGHPEENWFPWLAARLRREGAKVIIPRLPTPQGQSLGAWHAAFEAGTGCLNANDVIIAHSLGCAFTLRVLERTTAMTSAAYLVAGMCRPIGHPQFDVLNASFFEAEFNWVNIRRACARFAVYHAENDPIVPFGRGEELAAALDTRIRVIHHGGHLNAAAGFIQFQRLLDDLRTDLPMPTP